jgi:hypothetical protein
VSDWNLSAVEQVVWDAFPRGALTDLRAGDPGADDLASAAGWGAERTVRGEVIAALLLGAAESEPGRVAAVRLAGARIAGPIDIREGDASASLSLTGCYLDCPPGFNRAACRAVELTGCALPGFNGKWLQARGSIRFEDCGVSGCIVLRNARVQGSLHLSASHLACAGREALSAGGIVLDTHHHRRCQHRAGTARRTRIDL